MAAGGREIGAAFFCRGNHQPLQLGAVLLHQITGKDIAGKTAIPEFHGGKEVIAGMPEFLQGVMAETFFNFFPENFRIDATMIQAENPLAQVKIVLVRMGMQGRGKNFAQPGKKGVEFRARLGRGAVRPHEELHLFLADALFRRGEQQTEKLALRLGQVAGGQYLPAVNRRTERAEDRHGQ